MAEETLDEKLEKRIAEGEGQPGVPADTLGHPLPKFTFPCPVCKQDISGSCYQLVTPQGSLPLFPIRCPNPECMVQLNFQMNKPIEVPTVKFGRMKK
jgi:hypothetical protein